MLRPTFFLLPACLVLATSHSAEPGRGLSVNSPFAPPGTPASGATGPTQENLEFAGVTTIGRQTQLVFQDKVSKKSLWLAKGESRGGITLVNYDAQREQAVLRIDGAEKVLTLRKARNPASPGHVVAPVATGFELPATPPVAGVPAADPNPPPSAAVLPPAPAAPADPKARQESEARMLVSDLLEIGMAQRRAYEEAQRKAAEGNAGTPPAPAPAEPPAPPRAP